MAATVSLCLLAGCSGEDAPLDERVGVGQAAQPLTWVEQQRLAASDGAGSADEFGGAVSLSGDTALVGAHRYYDSHIGNAGSAYVFVRSGSTWTEQQKLTASDGALNDEFGISLSISGDTALVGATGDDDNGEESGSAYVWV
ncbi:MAG: FG-GAP repeat protein [Deltaproteobacteria bacterium]|jgi:hypothetical protein|nr:FG-GAP repeat protein [Deltaproteobacteria bacterium]